MTSNKINCLSLSQRQYFYLISQLFQYKHKWYQTLRNTSRQKSSNKINIMSQSTNNKYTKLQSKTQSLSHYYFYSSCSTIRNHTLLITKLNYMKQRIQHRQIYSIFRTYRIFNHYLNSTIKRFIQNSPPSTYYFTFRMISNKDSNKTSQTKIKNEISQSKIETKQWINQELFHWRILNHLQVFILRFHIQKNNVSDDGRQKERKTTTEHIRSQLIKCYSTSLRIICYLLSLTYCRFCTSQWKQKQSQVGTYQIIQMERKIYKNQTNCQQNLFLRNQNHYQIFTTIKYKSLNSQYILYYCLIYTLTIHFFILFYYSGYLTNL